MAICWVDAENEFKPCGPLNRVLENQHGKDLGASLYYPNVSACSTITLQLEDGALLGAQLARSIPGVGINAIMMQMQRAIGSREITAVYFVGRLEERQETPAKDAGYDWPAMRTTLYKVLGRPRRAAFKAFLQPPGTYHYHVTTLGGQARWRFKGPVGDAPIDHGQWMPLTMFDIV